MRKNKLKKLCRELVGFSIRYSGISFLLRNIYARNKVTIVVYHDPSPVHLAKHLRYLSKRYNFITLDMLVAAIRSKNWDHIPPRSLVMTMDDGHKGNFRLLDIFNRYKIEPTIYICSQIVDTKRHFWFRIKNIVPDEFKDYTNKDRLAKLEKMFGYWPTRDCADRQALSRNEIMTMIDCVSFQSHSLFHPVLTMCSDDECRQEITQSKENIEILTKRQCRHFAYPNGDYTGREVRMLKEAGYLSARTIDVGWNDVNTDPFKLKVTGISDDASVNYMSAQLSGLTMYLKYLAKGNIRGKHSPKLLSPHVSASN